MESSTDPGANAPLPSPFGAASGSPVCVDEGQGSVPGDGVMHLVGIGASAGGLEALQALLGNLQPGGTVAYAVAQHLSPDHRSHLVDLLSRCTAPEVQEAVDGALLRPGCVNIGPPGKDLTVQGHQLVVSAPEPRFGPSPSVDRLFESMAQHWQERGAAVVLSGTGSDGARGLRAVRAAGG